MSPYADALLAALICAAFLLALAGIYCSPAKTRARILKGAMRMDNGINDEAIREILAMNLSEALRDCGAKTPAEFKRALPHIMAAAMDATRQDCGHRFELKTNEEEHD